MSPDQLRVFRLNARKKGFSEVQINAEIARKQQEEARAKAQVQQARTQQAPLSLQQPTAPISRPIEPKSIGGFAKNAVKDTYDLTVGNAINTAKNVATAGFEGARAVASNIDIGRSEKKRKELERATQAFKAEKDPKKKAQLVAKSKLISKELDKIQGSLQADQAQNPFGDVNQVPSSIGEFGSGILKNIGRSFGYDDTTGTFNVETALQSAYERPVSTALLAKDIGSGVKKLSGKGSTKSVVQTTQKEAGILERTGTDLRKGVLNPKASADPFYSESVSKLQSIQKKLGLKGSAEVQLKQLPNVFKKTQTEIQNLIKKSPKTKKGVLADEFLNEIDGANYTLDDPQFKTAIDNELSTLSKLDGESPTAIYKQMSKYRDLLKSTRKKLDRGTTLLPKEEARLAAFNALKSTIDSVSPEVRALNTLQNQIYQISEGLVKSTGKKGIGVGPIRLPNAVSQGVQDAAGQALEGSSSLGTSIKDAFSSRVPSIPTGAGVASSLTQPLGGESQSDTGVLDESLGIDSLDEQVSEEPQEDSGLAAHPIFGKATKQEVLLDAFKAGLNEAQLKEIETTYDRFAPEGATVGKESMAIANDLRKEYISETKNNNFREITNAYKKVVSAPDTPAGDVSLIFAYMKLLDPGSTVREGEFATAENTAGIPERIVTAYNKALGGKRLGDSQRSGFIDASRAVYDDYQSSQQAIDEQYQELATQYGIDPSLLGIGTISKGLEVKKK